MRLVHAAVWRACGCTVSEENGFSCARPETRSKSDDSLTSWHLVQQAPLLQLSVLRSLTKLAVYIGNDQLDWQRQGASVMVSTCGMRHLRTPSFAGLHEEHDV